ncbi:MAG: hypothetical protein A2128_00425 [Candidatus Liptonbacteria bacterium GWC1_60_9]|uniref:Uncharacterized protein n=3 Tax=Candidatus Liptoniibacteriota TaxID=1817909 RepID=A0A1G2CPV9_9BACT|nr:MAG: hypothetical protein UZ00_C0004G0016 [Parcubacteria group bacterium GW2011_GWA1_60_11]OGY97632.1 MAG: hypothetical protein A2128_00425 [Candidatus Liptonbacteria bacterium GWC1_60_9]OGY99912.1 MAG: hypothetical protein A3E09_01065 [Candidatus Liptonbacteria bacterium RIFCSPHIGHO2_12_FULL_60_13]OGZ02488.1 MAG: hypothetical protein A3G64_02175 [Candidatus Liptonbacteria bacterium RIFCSPLOWO2_12_FULL_60_15]
MRRRLATLALLLAVAILLPPVARGEGQERAIPNVERWRPCETRRPYPFFETVFCMNPNGSGEIGAHAYHLTARGRVFLGKAWGVRKKWGGLFGLNYANIRAVMMLEDGRLFFGARGAKPEFVPILDTSGVETIGLRIRLKGPDGSYAKRVIKKDAH